MDHLASALKKGGIKDLPTFFPPNRRSDSIIDAHFRGAGQRDDQPSDVRPDFI